MSYEREEMRMRSAQFARDLGGTNRGRTGASRSADPSAGRLASASVEASSKESVEASSKTHLASVYASSNSKRPLQTGENQGQIHEQERIMAGRGLTVDRSTGGPVEAWRRPASCRASSPDRCGNVGPIAYRLLLANQGRYVERVPGPSKVEGFPLPGPAVTVDLGSRRQHANARWCGSVCEFSRIAGFFNAGAEIWNLEPSSQTAKKK
ncbi:hypothetical protein FB451DRAFT_1196957 [Mycena latifolia]|nr:hypothetical protein FB451DRAFT_1196957 [Mycena latifolia]